jgi:hypothetical protein
MNIKINQELENKINSGYLKAKDMVGYLLSNCDMELHFKIKDIKGELTEENVNSQLSISQLYNDDEKNIKKLLIDLENKILKLEF